MLRFTSRFGLAALAAAGLFLVFSANAAQNVTSRPGSRAFSPTQRFVWSAAQINMAEIAIGKLALQKSSNPNVRDFGNMLVRDHSQNMRELENLAASEKVKLPTTLNHRHRALYSQLSSLSGQQFDAQFANDMVKGHQQAIQLFENISHSTSVTPGVKAYAAKTLPVLRQHLNTAESLKNSATANAGRRIPSTRSEQPANVSMPQAQQQPSR